MSRELSGFLGREFNKTLKGLRTTWSVNPSVLIGCRSDLKRLHSSYLAMECLAGIVSGRRPRNEYIAAVGETSNLAIVLALKGLENPAVCLLRQSVELVLKDVYFTTHPTEYQWTQDSTAYKEVTAHFLFDYLHRVLDMVQLPESDDLCKTLNREYHILCRYVHVHSKDFLKYGPRRRSTAASSMAAFAKTKERALKLWPLLIVVLLACHIPEYLRSSIIERELIQHALPKELKVKIKLFLKARALVK